MDIPDRVNCLKKIDLFAAFSDDELAGFAKDIKEVQYSSGDMLCEEGEPGDEMFILLNGKLKVYKDKRTIAVLSPIDYVGEMAIIETKPRSASVQVVDDSMLLEISARQFRTYFADQPRSLVSLMQTLSQRIRKDTEVLAEEFEKANILVHDMRNVLSMFIFLDSLGREIGDRPAQKQVSFMKKARQDLAIMMDEALANAKRLHYQPILAMASIESVIQEIVESEGQAHPDLIDKSLRYIPTSPTREFIFNQAEIRRVLVNLLINAGQASCKGQKIEIRSCHEENGVRIAVCDHGQGIEPQFMDRIFSAHFTTREEGNGLGLASCRRIVEKHHGGSIEVACREWETVFTVYLPYNGCIHEQ